MKPRNALEGVGAALLLLMPFYCKFLLPSNLEIYHLHLPVTHLIGGLLIDLFVYFILVTGFLAALQYLPPIPQRILSALFAALMLWVMVDFAFMTLIHVQVRAGYLGRLWQHGAVAILLVAVVVAYRFPRCAQLGTRAVRLVVAAAAFSAFWIVPQLLHVAMTRQSLPDPATGATVASPAGASHRRIVWILFDELSYDQTFDHPAPGMQLPNFARLRTRSVSFSALQPAGFYTDRIIPSLFTGQRIDRIRSTIDGRLWLKDPVRQRWTPFDPGATLFALAQRNGWTTGVDGWFNPYCRILAPYVENCSWEANPTPIEEYGASEQNSMLANAAVFPVRILAPARHIATPEEGHLELYRRIMMHAQALIDGGGTRFLFVHIPVPHGPGIYDRRRHILRPGGTYLDRLALADETLGSLIEEIDASPSAPDTTVIVSSDHSWRISLSRHGEEWSEEEERASKGRFDDRPVLLVHFAGQLTGREVNAALPEMIEHDMIAGMLLGRIEDVDDLAAFISRQAR